MSGLGAPSGLGGAPSALAERQMRSDTGRKKVPVSEMMDRFGTGCAQLETMILAGGVFMTEGCLLVLVSVIVRTLEVKWKNSIMDSMLLACAMFFGVSIGCMVGGLNSDTYGRRPAILVCYVGTVVMLPIGAAAMHYLYLLVGNAIIGFFFGYGIPAAQSLIAETCPSSQRSNLVCMSAILFAVGQMIAGIVVWIVNPYLVYEDLNWRMMLVLSTLPLLALIPIVYFRLLESPIWLYVHGEKALSEETLRKFAYRNGVDYDRVVEKDRDTSDPLLTTRSDSYADMSKRSNEGEESWKERARALFAVKYRSSTLILMFLCFASNMCYYGMIYILPETFAELMLLLEDKDEHGAHLSPALNLMLSAVFEIPGVLLAIVLSGSLRRKTSLCISFSVVSISCISLVAASQRQEHAVMLTSLTAFSGKLFVASAFILTYLFVLEVYPTALRSSGLAFCMTFGRFGALVIPLLAEVLLEYTNSSIYVFLALGTMAAIAAVVCALLPSETAVTEDDGSDPDAQAVLSKGI